MFMLPGAYTNAASAKCVESHPGGYSPCVLCIAGLRCAAVPFFIPFCLFSHGASQALGKVGSTLLCPSSAFLSADVLLLCGGGQGFGEGVSGMSRQVEVEEEKTSSTTQKLHRLP